MKTQFVGLTVVGILSLCLGAYDEKKAPASATSADKPAVEAPEKAKEESPKPAAVPGDMKASKVEKAVAEWGKDDVKSAFEKSGWMVGSAVETTSSNLVSITVVATKGEAKATVSYFRGGSDFWKKSLEKDGASIHEEEGILLGVLIKNDKEGSQTLLNSLLGK